MDTDLQKKEEPSFREFLGKFKFTSGFSFRNYKHDSIFNNIISCVFLLIASLVVWGAFLILKPFLNPLLWALLCGSVFHPFKFALCRKIKNGINSMNTPYIFPIILDIACFPLNCLIDVSENASQVIINHWYSMLISSIVLTLFMFTPQFCVSIFSSLLNNTFNGTDVLLNIFSNKFLVLTMIIATFVIVHFYKSFDQGSILTVCSVVTWFAVSCYISSLFGILKFLIFFLIHFLVIFGLISDITNFADNSTEDETKSKDNFSQNNDGTKRSEKIRYKRSLSDVSSLYSFQTPNIRKYVKRFSSESSDTETTTENLDKQNENFGDLYIYWVIGGCFFTLLTKFWWLPLFLLLLAFVYIVRSVYVYIGIQYIVGKKLSTGREVMTSWFESPEAHVLIPLPVRVLYKMMVKTKIKLLTGLLSCADTISTVVVMLSVVVFITVAFVFLTTQVYREGVYLVKVGSKVVNDTMLFNPELMGSLPDDWKDHVDYALSNAYLYGRDVLSKMIKKLLSDADNSKVQELESIILELWDRIYQAWLVNCFDDSSIGPKVNSEAVYQLWDKLTLNVKNTPVFSMSAVMNFVNDNMTILLSTTSSVWEFLKDNVGLVLYLVQSLLYVVLISSSTVFGFFIDIVVFLTALFYLLSSSGEFYKPVEFIREISPFYGTRLALAIERSVTEVFMVSFKLAIFYGLYTWLLHTLFQTSLVYVPTVLAAVFAVIPVISTYWVCLPAVIDLWLIDKNPLGAIVLFVLQFIPTNIVDTTIYEDIHGGHPYLTGLSMAGGVLCFGIQGAIIGPLILCFAFVIFKFSTFVMKETDSPGSSKTGYINQVQPN